MATPSTQTTAAGPLAGVRVIELGQLIAGPFCGKTLAEFGGEVVKIKATIKAHTEYKNVKETRLSRPKLVEAK